MHGIRPIQSQPVLFSQTILVQFRGLSDELRAGKSGTLEL